MIQYKLQKRLKVNYSINFKCIIGLPIFNNVLDLLESENIEQTGTNSNSSQLEATPSRYMVKVTGQGKNNQNISHKSQNFTAKDGTINSAIPEYNLTKIEQSITTVDFKYDFSVVLEKQDQYNYKIAIVDIEVVELLPATSTDNKVNTNFNLSRKISNQSNIKHSASIRRLLSRRDIVGESTRLNAPPHEPNHKVLVKSSINIANLHTDAVHYYKRTDGSTTLLFSITSETTGKISGILSSISSVYHQYRCRGYIYHLLTNFMAFSCRQLTERMRLIMQYSVDYSKICLQYQRDTLRYWLMSIENMLYTQLMIYNEAYVHVYLHYAMAKLYQDEMHQYIMILESCSNDYDNYDKEYNMKPTLKFDNIKYQNIPVKIIHILPRLLHKYIKLSTNPSNTVHHSPYISNSRQNTKIPQYSSYVSNSRQNTKILERSPYISNSRQNTKIPQRSPYVSNSRQNTKIPQYSPYVSNSRQNTKILQRSAVLYRIVDKM